MTDAELTTLIKHVSDTENTPELSSYWLERYRTLLGKGKFALNVKTYELLIASGDATSKPVTPFGDIVVSKHLTAQGELDKVSLQASIETSVRFLDACLDAINFTPEAKHLISQYRKIGIGIKEYEDYVQSQQKEAEIGSIDELGEMMSSVAYRASETLAFEKGACKNWSQIDQHLRPKSFELWKHDEQDAVKTGLALSDEFDEESIKKSLYHIIPRRNSHVLLFPEDLEWQLWSDRDASAPPTPLTPFTPEVTPPIVDLKPMSEPQKTDTPSPVASITSPEVSTSKEPKQEPQNQENNIPKESPQPQSKPEKPAEVEEFEIGELVKVVDSQSPHKGKIFQVINGVSGTDTTTPARYNLYGHGIKEGEFWTQSQLESIELDQILEAVNSHQTPAATQPTQESQKPQKQTTIYLILNSDSSQNIVVGKGRTYHLPFVSVDLNTDNLLDTITNLITKKYKLGINLSHRAYIYHSNDDQSFYCGVIGHVNAADTTDLPGALHVVNIYDETLSKHLPADQARVLKDYCEEDKEIQDLLEFNEEMKQQLATQKTTPTMAKQTQPTPQPMVAPNTLSEAEIQAKIVQKEHRLREEFDRKLAEEKNRLEREKDAEISRQVEAQLAQKAEELTHDPDIILKNPEVKREIENRAHGEIQNTGAQLAARSSISLLKMMKKHSDDES
jgi:pterin-4a-carbinolamine dehydratase